eukprot:6194895-Pleurochrysis_carterae.AAC.1
MPVLVKHTDRIYVQAVSPSTPALTTLHAAHSKHMQICAASQMRGIKYCDKFQKFATQNRFEPIREYNTAKLYMQEYESPTSTAMTLSVFFTVVAELSPRSCLSPPFK